MLRPSRRPARLLVVDGGRRARDRAAAETPADVSSPLRRCNLFSSTPPSSPRLRHRSSRRGRLSASCCAAAWLLAAACCDVAAAANTATQTLSLSASASASVSVTASVSESGSLTATRSASASESATLTLTLPTASATATATATDTWSATHTLSETVTMTIPTATASGTPSLSATFSITLPTATASTTLTLPTETYSMTVPTGTETATLTLPTATASATSTLSLTETMTLPTASDTDTASLSATYSLSESVSLTDMSFGNHSAWLEPAVFRSGQEVRVRVATTLEDFDVRATNSSLPLAAEFAVFRHDAALGGDCNAYVAAVRARTTEPQRERRRRELRGEAAGVAAAPLHVLARGAGSADTAGLPDFSDASPYAAAFHFTFSAPHHAVPFVVCLNRRQDVEGWSLREDLRGWQLLRFGAAGAVRRAAQSRVYYELPEATAGQYAVLRLLSDEAGRWNFSYAASAACGRRYDAAALQACTGGDLLKLVPRGSPCTAEVPTGERRLREYAGTAQVLADGVFDAGAAAAAVTEGATPGGVGLFGTGVANPLLDRWTAAGSYGALADGSGAAAGHEAAYPLSEAVSGGMRVPPTHPFGAAAHVYVRLPEREAVGENSTVWANEFDVCFSAREERVALLGQNETLASLPVWRKLFPCNPYHAACTRGDAKAEDDSWVDEETPSFAVRAEYVGWTMFDLSPASWGAIVFDAGGRPVLNTHHTDVFNGTVRRAPSTSGGAVPAAPPAFVERYFESAAGGDFFRLVHTRHFREAAEAAATGAGSFPSQGCWHRGLDAAAYSGFTGEQLYGDEAAAAPLRSAHGGLANEGAEYPIGSRDLRGDPTLTDPVAAAAAAAAAEAAATPRPLPADDANNKRRATEAFATLYVPEEGAAWHVCYRLSCSASVGVGGTAAGCVRNTGLRVLPYHGRAWWTRDGAPPPPAGVRRWLHLDDDVLEGSRASVAAAERRGVLQPAERGDLLNGTYAYTGPAEAERYPPALLSWTMNDTRMNTYGPLLLATANRSYGAGGYIDTRGWTFYSEAAAHMEDVRGSVVRLVPKGTPCEHDSGLLRGGFYNPMADSSTPYYAGGGIQVPAAEQRDGGELECATASAGVDAALCAGSSANASNVFDAAFYLALPRRRGYYRVCHRTRAYNWVSVPEEGAAPLSYAGPYAGDAARGNGSVSDFLLVADDALDEVSVDFAEVRSGVEALFVVADRLARSSVGPRTRASSADVLRLAPARGGVCDVNPANWDPRTADTALLLFCPTAAAAGTGFQTDTACAAAPPVAALAAHAVSPTPYLDLVAAAAPGRYGAVVPFDVRQGGGVAAAAAALQLPAYAVGTGVSSAAASAAANSYLICYKQTWTANWVVFNETLEVAPRTAAYEVTFPTPGTGALLGGMLQGFELRLRTFAFDQVARFAAKLVASAGGDGDNSCLREPAGTEAQYAASQTTVHRRGKSDAFIEFDLVVPASAGRYVLCVMAQQTGRELQEDMGWLRVRRSASLWAEQDYTYDVGDNGVRWWVGQGARPVNQGVVRVQLRRCAPAAAAGSAACVERSDGAVFDTGDSLAPATALADRAKVVEVAQPCSAASAHVGVEAANATAAQGANGFRFNLGPSDGLSPAAEFVVALPAVAGDVGRRYKVCVRALFAAQTLLPSVSDTHRWVEVSQYAYDAAAAGSAATLARDQVVVSETGPRGTPVPAFRTLPAVVQHWSVASELRPLSTLVSSSREGADGASAISAGGVVAAGSHSSFVAGAPGAAPAATVGFVFTMHPAPTPSPTSVPSTSSPTGAPTTVSPAPATPAPTAVPDTPVPATPTPVVITPAPPTHSPHAARVGRFDAYKLVLVARPQRRVPAVGDSAVWGDVDGRWQAVAGASCLSPGAELASNDPEEATAGCPAEGPAVPATAGACPTLAELGGTGRVGAALQFPLQPGKYLVCYRRAHPSLEEAEQPWTWVSGDGGDSGLYVQPSFLEMEVEADAAAGVRVFDLNAGVVAGATRSLASWCRGTAGFGGNGCATATGYANDLVQVVDGRKTCAPPPAAGAAASPAWFRTKRVSAEAAVVDTNTTVIPAGTFVLPPASFPLLGAYKLCVYKALSPSSNVEADGSTPVSSSAYVLRAGLVYQLYNRGADPVTGGLSGVWRPRQTTSGQRRIAAVSVHNEAPEAFTGSVDPSVNLLDGGGGAYVLEFNRTVADVYVGVPAVSLPGALRPYEVHSSARLTFTLLVEGGSRSDAAVTVEQCALPASDAPLSALFCETVVPNLAVPSGRPPRYHYNAQEGGGTSGGGTNTSAAATFVVEVVGGSCSAADSLGYRWGRHALTQLRAAENDVVEVTVRYASGCLGSPFGCGIRFKARDATNANYVYSNPFWVRVAARVPDAVRLNGGTVGEARPWLCYHNQVCRLTVQAMHRGTVEHAPEGRVVATGSFQPGLFAVNSALNSVDLPFDVGGALEYLALPRLLVGVDAAAATLTLAYGDGAAVTLRVSVVRRSLRSAAFRSLAPLGTGGGGGGGVVPPPAPTWAAGLLDSAYLVTTSDYLLRVATLGEDGHPLSARDEPQGWVVTGQAPTRNAVLLGQAAAGMAGVNGSEPRLLRQPVFFDDDGAYVVFRVANGHGCYRGVGCRLSFLFEAAGRPVVAVHVDVAVRVVGDRLRVTPESALTFRNLGVPVTLEAGRFDEGGEWEADEFHQGSYFALLHSSGGGGGRVALVADTTQPHYCVLTEPCVPAYWRRSFLLKTNAPCANCTVSVHSTEGAESPAPGTPNSLLTFTLLDPIARLECGITTPNITFFQGSPESFPFTVFVQVVSRITGAPLAQDLTATLDVAGFQAVGYTLKQTAATATLSLGVQNGEATVVNAVIQRVVTAGATYSGSLPIHVDGPQGMTCDTSVKVVLGDVRVTVTGANAADELYVTVAEVEAGVAVAYSFSDGVARALEVLVSNEPVQWSQAAPGGPAGYPWESATASLSSLHDPFVLPTHAGNTFTYGTATVVFHKAHTDTAASGVFTMRYSGSVAAPVRRATIQICGGVDICLQVYLYVAPDVTPPLSLAWYQLPANAQALAASCSDTPMPSSFVVGVVYTVSNEPPTLKFLHYSAETEVVLSYSKVATGTLASNETAAPAATGVFVRGNATTTVGGVAAVSFSGAESGVSAVLRLEAAAIGSTVTTTVAWATISETYQSFELLPSVVHAACPEAPGLNMTLGGYRRQKVGAAAVQGGGWAYADGGCRVGVPTPFQAAVLTSGGGRAWSFRSSVRVTKLPAVSGCNDGGSVSVLGADDASQPGVFTQLPSGLTPLRNGVATVWLSFSAPCQRCTLRLDLCYTSATAAAACLVPPAVPAAGDLLPITANRVQFTKPFTVTEASPSAAQVASQALPPARGTHAYAGAGAAVPIVHTGDVFSVSLEAVGYYGGAAAHDLWAARVGGVLLDVRVVSVWRPVGTAGGEDDRYGNGGFVKRVEAAAAAAGCGAATEEARFEYAAAGVVEPTLSFAYTRPCSRCEVRVDYRFSSTSPYEPAARDAWRSLVLGSPSAAAEAANAAYPAFRFKVNTCGAAWLLAPATPRHRFRFRPFAVSIWKLDANGHPAWEGEERVFFAPGRAAGNGGGGRVALVAGNAVEGTSLLVSRGVGTVVASATRACFRCEVELRTATQTVAAAFAVQTRATHVKAYPAAAAGSGLASAAGESSPVWGFDLYASDENGDRDFTVRGEVEAALPLELRGGGAVLDGAAAPLSVALSQPALAVPFDATVVRATRLGEARETLAVRPPFRGFVSWSVPFAGFNATLDASCGAGSGTLVEGTACRVAVRAGGAGGVFASRDMDGRVVTADAAAAAACPCAVLELTPEGGGVVGDGVASFSLRVRSVALAEGQASCDCGLRFALEGAGNGSVAPLTVRATATGVAAYGVVDDAADGGGLAAATAVILNEVVVLRIGGFDAVGAVRIDKTLPAAASVRLLPASCFAQTGAAASMGDAAFYEVSGRFAASCRLDRLAVDGAEVSFLGVDVEATLNPKLIAVQASPTGQTLRLAVKDEASRIVRFYRELSLALTVNGAAVKTYTAVRGEATVAVADAAAAARGGPEGTPPGSVDGQWVFTVPGSPVSSVPLAVLHVPEPARVRAEYEAEQVAGAVVPLRLLVLDSHGSLITGTSVPLFAAEAAVPCRGYPATCAGAVALTSRVSEKQLEAVLVEGGVWEGFLHRLGAAGGVAGQQAATEDLALVLSSDGFRSEERLVYRVARRLEVEAVCVWEGGGTGKGAAVAPSARCDFVVSVRDDRGRLLAGDRVGTLVHAGARCLSDPLNRTAVGQVAAVGGGSNGTAGGIAASMPTVATLRGVGMLTGIEASHLCAVAEVSFVHPEVSETAVWRGSIEGVDATVSEALRETVYGALVVGGVDTLFEANETRRALHSNATRLAAAVSTLGGGIEATVTGVCVALAGLLLECGGGGGVAGAAGAAGSGRAGDAQQQTGGYEVSVYFSLLLLARVDAVSFSEGLDAAIVADLGGGALSVLNGHGAVFNATLSVVQADPLEGSWTPPPPPGSETPPVPTAAPSAAPASNGPSTPAPTEGPTPVPVIEAAGGGRLQAGWWWHLVVWGVAALRAAGVV